MTLLWVGVSLLVVMLVACVAAYVWFVRGDAAFERELAELGLGPVYERLQRSHAAGEIDFGTMMRLRQIELRAAQLARELSSMAIPADQAAVVAPQGPLDAEALDLLASRGTVSRSTDGAGYVYPGK